MGYHSIRIICVLRFLFPVLRVWMYREWVCGCTVSQILGTTTPLPPSRVYSQGHAHPSINKLPTLLCNIPLLSFYRLVEVRDVTVTKLLTDEVSGQKVRLN